jgi:integrase/recombinase XerD
MSFEQFRSSFSSRLVDRLPAGLLHDVLQELDIVAADYDIKRSCTDLIVYEGLPEIVKLYCAALAVENKAHGTIDGYRRELIRFFEFVRKPFTVVTTNDIRLYLYHRQHEQNLQKSSVEHVRVVINAFFSWLVDDEYIDRNPARKIEPIRVPKEGREPIPAVELERLRLACRTDREKALIDFLYSTGCRISECAALTVNDIDWRDSSVRIRHGKGDKARTVYFNPESEVSLRHYLDNKPHPSLALFSATRAPYGHVTKEALEAEVRHIRSRVANLSVEVVPHALRTTFATNASRNGMPVEHVQKLLGHSNINTTMRYVKVDQDEAKSSHRKFIA